MTQEVTLNSTTSTVPEYELFEGGFTADTVVITTDGPVPVANLAAGDRVYALNPTTKLVKPKPVTGIEEFEYSGEAAHIEARRVDLLLHPAQRVPYCTRSIETVRFQSANELHERERYLFINDWRTPPNRRLKEVDVTDLIDDFQVCVSNAPHGNTFRANLPDGCDPIDLLKSSGYQFDSETFKRYQEVIESLASEIYIRDKKRHKRRPYRFDGDDFIRLIAWYVTEGCITWRDSNDTADIHIAQDNDECRERIASLFSRLGIDVLETDSRISFSSRVYGRLFEELCGNHSGEKRLPEFVWKLSDDQQRLLLSVLLDGDGNNQNVYFTKSDRLRDDVLRLGMELGIKPRYVFCQGVWEIYTNSVNDRLGSSEQVSITSIDDMLYRLTVEDYSVVMAGRNGKFQWIGVSRVS